MLPIRTQRHLQRSPTCTSTTAPITWVTTPPWMEAELEYCFAVTRINAQSDIHSYTYQHRCTSRAHLPALGTNWPSFENPLIILLLYSQHPQPSSLETHCSQSFDPSPRETQKKISSHRTRPQPIVFDAIHAATLAATSHKMEKAPYLIN